MTTTATHIARVGIDNAAWLADPATAAGLGLHPNRLAVDFGDGYVGLTNDQVNMLVDFGENADGSITREGDTVTLWIEGVGFDFEPVAGELYDVEGEYLRPATADELRASVAAAERDDGAGVIEVGGVSVYVVDEMAIQDGVGARWDNALTQATAHSAGTAR